MNKQELIDAVAAGAGVSKSDASKAVQAVLDAITDAVSRGETARLIGFGAFSLGSGRRVPVAILRRARRLSSQRRVP